MVDDPSGYVDVLLSDTEETEGCGARAQEARCGDMRRKRTLAHDDAIAEAQPTLEEVIAEQERDRLFAIIEELVLWENTTNEEVLEPARREIWQSWRRACAENAAIREPRKFSIGTNSRLFTIRSRGVERSRWRRSGWGWKPMRVTSTRWRC